MAKLTVGQKKLIVKFLMDDYVIITRILGFCSGLGATLVLIGLIFAPTHLPGVIAIAFGVGCMMPAITWIISKEVRG